MVGPFNSPGVSETPSRQRVFICQNRDGPGAEARTRSDCARRIAANLARRAFRRPVTDADVDPLMPFFEAGRKAGSFDSGIEHLVAAVLVSPDFLYRAIRTGQHRPPGGHFAPRSTDRLELASRLSFFLWSQGPDDELLDAAAARSCARPKRCALQALRMLGDRRASSW